MFTKEMKHALEVDGRKLRELTGEDHGPEFWITCEACCGEGSIEKPHPFPDDPYYCDVFKCDACNGVGLIHEEGVSVANYLKGPSHDL